MALKMTIGRDLRNNLSTSFPLSGEGGIHITLPQSGRVEFLNEQSEFRNSGEDSKISSFWGW